jgi:uncharacterized protein (DUF302 family)
MTDDRIVTEADVVTKLSHQPVPDTVAKLTAMISAKGMRLFAVIDQAAEAGGPGSPCGRLRWSSSAVLRRAPQ